MLTTIQISTNLQHELQNRKLYDNETYEEIIWDMIEDNLELSDEMKTELKEAEKEIKKGKTIPLEEIEKELKL